MPLPDADPDKRMYKLLKNIDLENLTFEQFQSTAQTVFAEPEAEDTLRRIVLINLARMSVAGDWNGLTTSGGGGGGSDMWSMGLPTDSFEYTVGAYAGGIRPNDYAYVDDTLFFTPFSLGEDATITTARYHISTIPSSTNVTIAIYSTDSDTGCPFALMDHNSTAQTTIGEKQITFASSIALTANTLYWIGLSHDNAGTFEVVGCVQYVQLANLPVIDSQAIGDNLNPVLVAYPYTWASSPPDPLTKASLVTEGQTQASYVPMIRLGI